MHVNFCAWCNSEHVALHVPHFMLLCEVSLIGKKAVIHYELAVNQFGVYSVNHQ